MASMKQKLSKLMNESFERTKVIPLNQSRSLKQQCTLNNGKREKTLNDMKLKGDKHKPVMLICGAKRKYNDLMNFDISREGLKKYQNKTSNGFSIDNTIQVNKEGRTYGGKDRTLQTLNIKDMFSKEPMTKLHEKTKSIPLTLNGINKKKYMLFNHKAEKNYEPLDISRNKTNDKNHCYDISEQLRESNDDDDGHNRIRTQINLFVKELNVNSSAKKSKTNHHHKNTITLHNNDHKNNKAYSSINTKKHSLNNTNRNAINTEMNQDYYPNALAYNNNLIINVLDSIPKSDSARDKRYQTYNYNNTLTYTNTTNNKKDNILSIVKKESLMKYTEIKAIKSSIYNMTNEEIASIPQDYIDKLKDLASLINSLM